MEYGEIVEFIKSIEQHSDKEIVQNIDYIYNYLKKVNARDMATDFLKIAVSVIKDIDIKSNLIIKYFYFTHKYQYSSDPVAFYNWRAIITVLKNSSDEEKKQIFSKMFKNIDFQEIQTCLDIPGNLKYGIEIEVTNTSFENIKTLFDNNMILQIMEAMSIPNDLAYAIINNVGFEEQNQFDKWIFSKEGESDDSPEASSPIMSNTLNDLNQINIICMLFEILGATTHGGTGLHINIGTDYFEGKEDAIKNLLLIWSECEELFFKISNEENTETRKCACTMSIPIKENIEKTLDKYGTITLNTQEDFDRFIYNIQGQNRIRDLLGYNHGDLEFALFVAKTDDQKYDVYKRYMAEKADDDTAIRYTSINFNHMTWNDEDER